MSVALFILLAFASSLAAAHAPKQMPADRIIRDLVDLALVAPPELAADVLLKLIEYGYITDAEWKREVLDTAWSLAPRATYTSEVAPAVDSAAASDTDSGSLSAALATGLSTAGLQARIISQMAKLDATETRKMFLQMSAPAGESLRCSADRYTSHRPYFEALTVVAETFSGEETKRRKAQVPCRRTALPHQSGRLRVVVYLGPERSANGRGIEMADGLMVRIADCGSFYRSFVFQPID